jgi:serine/threonine protein kinase/Tfp pilus assembly protein PilF
VRGDDLAVAALAESVADGTPVDWQTIEQQSPQVKRLARHLRLVDSIAALHRSMPSEDAAPVAREPEVARGRRWGRLVLLEPIGSGTSCDVYRAWDAELHRDVALKLLHEESDSAATAPRPGALQSHDGDHHAVQARVLQEARRMARLSHGHVVQVYGAEQHDGRVGLWMELVRGTSLEQLVKQRGSFGANEAALIGLDVCAALAAVHGAGLLHRDVKAQNVMREDGGRIVLMDFGTGEELAGTNRLVGTPLYLAPEIFAGQRASVQSDVYAVGVLLFYLVTGTFPVSAASMEELARAHQQRDRRSLRDLRPDAPQAFVAVVERALDSDPNRRFRTVGELETALRQSLVSPQQVRLDPSQRESAVDAAPSPARVRRPSAAVLLVAALIAGLVLAAALMLWRRNPGAADARPSRIAVLPLRSESATAPYLADRLTDDLIATLGQIQSLQVTSLDAVLAFKGSPAAPQQIGRALAVDSLLESSLLVTPTSDGKADRVRVRARLLTAGGAQIWNREFERSFGEVGGLYGDIAGAVVEALGISLKPEEAKLLTRARVTQPEANEAYLLGTHLLSQSSVDAEAAIAAFRRAIEIDPNHAGAHAGVARGLLALGLKGTMRHPAARATAAAELRKALELDPDSSEAHTIDADLRFRYDWDWAGADRAYRRAIALNPSNARARSQYARYLAAASRSAEALIEARRGVEIEPGSASAVSTRAMIEYYARDNAKALQSANYAIQLEPASGSHHFVRGRVLSTSGDLSGAIQSLERAIELVGEGTPTSWRTHLLRLRALAGDRARAASELEQLIADFAARRQSIGAAHIAYVRDALGDRDQAIALLNHAVSERDPDVLWLNVDPRVDGLRSDPRFVDLLTRIGPPR